VSAVRRLDNENGIAIVMALGALLAVTAVALSVAILASVELQIAFNTRTHQETMRYAEAAVELTSAALAAESDWSKVLSGLAVGDFPGASHLPTIVGWGALDLDDRTRRLQVESNASRPWGPNDAIWRLYAHGRPSELLFTPQARDTPYVAVWVGDDEAEVDGAPERDGNGELTIRAEAFGLARAHAVVLATVRRRPNGTEVVSWRVPVDRSGD
jgi:hypothetical protein